MEAQKGTDSFARLEARISVMMAGVSNELNSISKDLRQFRRSLAGISDAQVKTTQMDEVQKTIETSISQANSFAQFIAEASQSNVSLVGELELQRQAQSGNYKKAAHDNLAQITLFSEGLNANSDNLANLSKTVDDGLANTASSIRESVAYLRGQLDQQRERQEHALEQTELARTAQTSFLTEGFAGQSDNLADLSKTVRADVAASASRIVDGVAAVQSQLEVQRKLHDAAMANIVHDRALQSELITEKFEDQSGKLTALQTSVSEKIVSAADTLTLGLDALSGTPESIGAVSAKLDLFKTSLTTSTRRNREILSEHYSALLQRAEADITRNMVDLEQRLLDFFHQEIAAQESARRAQQTEIIEYFIQSLRQLDENSKANKLVVNTLALELANRHSEQDAYLRLTLNKMRPVVYFLHRLKNWVARGFRRL